MSGVGARPAFHAAIVEKPEETGGGKRRAREHAHVRPLTPPVPATCTAQARVREAFPELILGEEDASCCRNDPQNWPALCGLPREAPRRRGAVLNPFLVQNRSFCVDSRALAQETYPFHMHRWHM